MHLKNKQEVLPADISRRDAVHKSGWILASAIFGPGLITSLQSCASEVANSETLLVFNATQYQLAQAMGDTILPRTNSPSASDVKVPEFIDLLLRDVFSEEVKEHLLTGLEQFEIACKKASGKSFLKLGSAQRQHYLSEIDKMVMSVKYADEIPFYYTFKKLCITTYLSTEEGIKQNLKYNPIPGPFQGDVKLDDGEIIEVGNEM